MSVTIVDYHDQETEIGMIEVRPGSHAAVRLHQLLIRKYDDDSLYAVVLDTVTARALVDEILRAIA